MLHWLIFFSKVAQELLVLFLLMLLKKVKYWFSRDRLRWPDNTQEQAMFIWRVFYRSAFALVVYVYAVQFNLFWLFGSSPGVEKLEKPKLDIASHIYSSDGALIGKYFKENRSPVKYDSINPKIIAALLSTEDVRYYEHGGVDPGATVSVILYALKGDNRGGSTITQQLAKNLYKTRKGQSIGLLGYVPGLSTVIAKTKEWITAIKLERHYTKEEIITMYLNTVDFGYNSFGVKIAANTYFSKPQEYLNYQEAAMLIGMLKATTYYNPKRNYGRALRRRNTVLAQMLKYEVLNRKQYDSLSTLPIKLRFQPIQNPDGIQTYYGAYLTKKLNEWSETEESTEEKPDIYTDGYKIYISIDSRIQKHAETAVNEHVKELQGRFDDHWRGRNPWADSKGNEIPYYIEYVMKRSEYWKKLNALYNNDTVKVWKYLNKPRKTRVFTWQNPEGDSLTMSPMDSLRYYKKLLHAGLMTLDPKTGFIKAWVGGLDFRFFQYDHVKQSRRQPGSTFKAIMYAAAMDRGYPPCFKLPDNWKKYKYKELGPDGDSVEKEWTPRNATGYFSGVEYSLRHAIGRSINSIAALLTERIGASTVVEYAKRLGFNSPLKPIPSIGLGSNDVSLYEMVGAYGAFINQGTYTEPILISRIEDHNGNIIKQFTPRRQKALSQEAAWMMIHMLKGTLQEPGGTAQGLFRYQVYRNNELGGKTGTSSNQSDGWFMGITKDLVTGVWVGAEERCVHFRTMRLGEGSKTALPIYGKFMEKVYADKSIGILPGRFEKPQGLNIDNERGKMHCPTFLPKKDTALPALDSNAIDKSLELDPSQEIPIYEQKAPVQ